MGTLGRSPGIGMGRKIKAFFDTECDRAKVPPYNGNDSTSRLEGYKPLCFQTYSDKHKQGDARGAREVRRRTSPIHFHRAVPRRPVILVPYFCGISRPKPSPGTWGK